MKLILSHPIKTYYIQFLFQGDISINLGLIHFCDLPPVLVPVVMLHQQALKRLKPTSPLVSIWYVSCSVFSFSFSILLGFVIMFHGDNYSALFVPFFDIAMRISSQVQRIASINDRFCLSPTHGVRKGKLSNCSGLSLRTLTYRFAPSLTKIFTVKTIKPVL